MVYYQYKITVIDQEVEKMKLSKSMVACLEAMKNEIDTARGNDFREWVILTQWVKGQTTEEKITYFEQHTDEFEWLRKYYESDKAGDVLISGYSANTLKALETRGLVSISKQDFGTTPIHTAKVLNY